MKTKLLIATCLALQLCGLTLPGLAQSETVEFTSDSYPVVAFGELTFALRLSAPLSQPAEIGVELLSADPDDPFGNPWLAGYVTIPRGETNRSITLLAPGLAMFGGQIRLSGEASPANVTPGAHRTARLVPLKEPVSVRFNLEESKTSVSVWLDGIVNGKVNVNYTIEPAPIERVPRGAISAVPGRDFDPASGTLALTPTSNESNVTIPVRPDRDPLVPPEYVVFKVSTTNDVWLPRSELLIEIPSLLNFSEPLIALEGNPAAFDGVPFWSSAGPVRFHYVTRERTALAGLDFARVEGDVSTGTNGGGFIALSILDNGLVEPTKEFDLVLSRPDTGEVFRTLPIRIVDNELPIPVAKDPTFRVTANIGGSQVLVRPDGEVLLLDPDKLELHSLTANGSLEKTAVLAPPGSFTIDDGSPGLVEPTRSLLLNVKESGVAGRLYLDSASSIVRVKPDGTIDRGFRIFGVNSSARALYVDAEGKILIALDGWGDRTWLLRYLPDGTREASFEPRWLERIILSVAAPRADGRFNVIYRFLNVGDSSNRGPRPAILDLTREEASLEEVGAAPAYLVTSDGWYEFDWSGFDLFGIEGLIKVSSDGRRVPEFFVPGYPFSSNPRLAAVQPDGKVLAFIEEEPGMGLVRFEASSWQRATQVDAAPIQPAQRSPLGRAYVFLYRAGDITRTQTVHYATKDDSAKAGVDYIASSGSVTFQPLEIEKRIEIELIASASSDLFVSFLVTLSDPTGGVTLGTSEISVRLLDIGSTLAISRGNGSLKVLARAFSGGNSFRLALEKTSSLAPAKWEPLIDPATGQEATRYVDYYIEYSIQLPVSQSQSFFRARLSP